MGENISEINEFLCTLKLYRETASNKRFWVFVEEKSSGEKSSLLPTEMLSKILKSLKNPKKVLSEKSCNNTKQPILSPALRQIRDSWVAYMLITQSSKIPYIVPNPDELRSRWLQGLNAMLNRR